MHAAVQCALYYTVLSVYANTYKAFESANAYDSTSSTTASVTLKLTLLLLRAYQAQQSTAAGNLTYSVHTKVQGYTHNACNTQKLCSHTL
jgi:hypothetical protein